MFFSKVTLCAVPDISTFYTGKRYLSKKSDDSGISSSGSESSSNDDGSDSGDGHDIPPPPYPEITALSPMTVPEEWPTVPIIPIRKTPLFPRFIKLIEVSKTKFSHS